MKKIVNEYVYDLDLLKQFYKCNLQTRLFLLLLILVLISGFNSFMDRDYTFFFFSIGVFILGCVYYFLLPNFLAKTTHRRLLEQANGKEVKLRVTINDKDIIIENLSNKNKNTYPLDSVRKIMNRKNILCLRTKEKVGILLSKEGFKQGSEEELYSIFMKDNNSN